MRLGTLNFWFTLGGKLAAQTYPCRRARRRRMEANGRESTKRMALVTTLVMCGASRPPCDRASALKRICASGGVGEDQPAMPATETKTVPQTLAMARVARSS